MGPIKMIVTDLDGTLLRSDKSISPHTRAVLSRCRENEIKLVYATGRGRAYSNLAAPAELFDARITQNGAIILIGDQIVSSSLIDREISRPFLEACDKRGLKTSSESGGIHYTNFDPNIEWPGSSIEFILTDFSQYKINSEKLYVVVNNPEEAAFVESRLPDELYMSLSRDGLGMIMHRDATKAKALASLAGIWGLSQKEIAAFGDDINDIDMLQYAGVSVAMANALDEVKAAADHLCPGNDEEGLAEWILANIIAP